MTAKHQRWRGTLTRELGRLAELPEQVFRTGVDLAEIAWKETRLKKVEAFNRHEQKAIETVAHTHFAGYLKSLIPFESPNGDKYKFAVMEREAGKDQHPEHAMVWIPGWFATFESFAEQARPELMKEYSQIMYNRPGTDRESAAIVDEEGYGAVEHFDTNRRVLEQILDRAVAQGRESFTLCGHSFGGILTQTFMEYAVEERPDLYDRIESAVLINSTKEENVVEGSFLDRLPLAPPVLRQVIERGIIAGEFMGKALRVVGRRAPDAIERRNERLASRVTEGLGLAMTIGYLDTMIGGDAKRDVYLASKGRAKQGRDKAMIYDGLAMMRAGKRNPKKINKPTLVVTAGKDMLLPDTGHWVAEQYATAHPRTHQVRELVFEEEGHCTPMTEPRIFNSAVRRFVEDPGTFMRAHGSRKHYRLKVVRAAD